MNATKQAKYAIRIGQELIAVRGTILMSGWLEWQSETDIGLAQPKKFCPWRERKKVFPDCHDCYE